MITKIHKNEYISKLSYDNNFFQYDNVKNNLIFVLIIELKFLKFSILNMLKKIKKDLLNYKFIFIYLSK